MSLLLDQSIVLPRKCAGGRCLHTLVNTDTRRLHRWKVCAGMLRGKCRLGQGRCGRKLFGCHVCRDAFEPPESILGLAPDVGADRWGGVGDRSPRVSQETVGYPDESKALPFIASERVLSIPALAVVYTNMDQCDC